MSRWAIWGCVICSAVIILLNLDMYALRHHCWWYGG